MTSRAVIVARHAVKRAAELVLDGSGAGALARGRMRGRDLVLAYHNVVEDREVRADASGHLGLSAFTAQMEELARLAHVVPLDRLAAPGDPASPARVAITFDDGYQGALRLAVPVLARLGLPATFFVCPALMGGGHFWWDVRGVDAWRRHAELLDRAQGRRERVLALLRAEGRDFGGLPDDARAADAALVRDAAARPGITLGAHTMHHPNLSAIGEDEVREELVAARDALAGGFPSFVPWVAYPFGLANAAVERIAAETGYVGGFVLDGGWIRPGARRFALTRLNVAAGLSVRGFRLRLGGLFAR